ncbi:MAG: imidazolonepropionase-like amidohydrolase [Alteromonadaceae bacterium]|jgi:imidazolonepropionase-like amidohydrolase
MKSLKVFKSSLLALAFLSVSSAANAESLAIINATVHTVTDQGVLTNATVIIDQGKIISINPDVISADKTLDANGRVLTPGLIGTMNQLGLVEVSAVSHSRDASEKKADITFDASLAYNPRSTVIAYTRKGGITRNIVTPLGGEDMFRGQTFVVDLSGSFDSVLASQSAVVIDFGAKSKGSRAENLQKFTNKLEDAQQSAIKNKSKDTKSKSKDKTEKQEPKRDEKVIDELLAGTKPLIAYADRATDILALIKIKERFKLNVVIVGAGDAIIVKEQLAKANVPVIINAMSNLPSSFDTLYTSLDTAAHLTAAGVKIILSVDDAHNLYKLRFTAGNAVANGLSKADALAAMTANVADVFGLDGGRIAVGQKADLVLWSADPLELSSHVDKLWIAGQEHSTQSRQDALRKRYMTESKLPKAYTK